VTTDIRTATEGRLARIRLARPKALHALTRDMCSAMIAALLDWRPRDEIRAVMLDHAEGRGFCAGGDVVMLARSGAGDGAEARAFFHEEYRLNHLLFTYAKPTIAFMDGIVMGGGVGISQPCRFRVATENTRFAMPETAIGLFPDVGGGWYLSRLPGRVGQFLALTGARLDGASPPTTSRPSPSTTSRRALPPIRSAWRPCSKTSAHHRRRRASRATARRSTVSSPPTITRTSSPRWRRTAPIGR
jgi:enoyl-CoA hydratase